MQRVLCCVLCLFLILAVAAPVSAVETNFMELLEYSTVNYSGSNRFTFTDTRIVKLDVPMYTPLRYIDIIFMADDFVQPTSVSVVYGDIDHNLQVKWITGDIYRAFGKISGLYEEVYIRFTADGTQSYTLQSCKVSAVTSSRGSCQASLEVQLNGVYYPGTIGTPFIRNPEDFYSAAHYSMGYQAQVTVKDATSFDLVHMQFASNYASISSVRCQYGTTTVPFTLNFIDIESDSSYFYYYENIGEGTLLQSYGKVIGSITVDLTGIDRSQDKYLIIIFNGEFTNNTGLYVNVSGIEGEVLLADTKEASWWSWAKDLLSNIKSLPERIAEELGKLYKPDQGKIQSVQQQSQELAEERLGAVYQAGQVVDGLVGAFQNQTPLNYLTVPVLTVPLGEVDWTIGGWTVQIVPDAFKPIVEILKTVIDIVCTLAFVKSMRNRFERMLVGGNA